MKYYENPEILEHLYWEMELTIPEVADELGCGPSTIHRKLDKYGIETREGGFPDEPHNKLSYVPLAIDRQGYERWDNQTDGYWVSVHRLLAMALYGTEEVKGMDVHHENEIPWDNRPDNIALMDPGEHRAYHRRKEASQ